MLYMPRIPQNIQSVGVARLEAFSRPRCPLAPSTSHSSSTLSLPLHCPTTVLLIVLVIIPLNFTPQDVACQSSFCFHTCPNHLTFLQQPIILRNLHYKFAYAWCNAPTTVFCSNCFEMPGCVSPDLCFSNAKRSKDRYKQSSCSYSQVINELSFATKSVYSGRTDLITLKMYF